MAIRGYFQPRCNQNYPGACLRIRLNKLRAKKGKKRKEKRQMELDFLQLFENESLKLIKAAQEKKEQAMEDINKRAEVEKMTSKIDMPFSHVSPVPPPYERKVKSKEVYPQLPVLSQDGAYQIKDDDQVIEVGQAETIITMYPSSKREKTLHLETKGGLKMRRKEAGDDSDQSPLERAIRGYDPVIRLILARAEKKGSKNPGERIQGIRVLKIVMMGAVMQVWTMDLQDLRENVIHHPPVPDWKKRDSVL